MSETSGASEARGAAGAADAAGVAAGADPVGARAVDVGAVNAQLMMNRPMVGAQTVVSAQTGQPNSVRAERSKRPLSASHRQKANKRKLSDAGINPSGLVHDGMDEEGWVVDNRDDIERAILEVGQLMEAFGESFSQLLRRNEPARRKSDIFAIADEPMFQSGPLVHEALDQLLLLRKSAHVIADLAKSGAFLSPQPLTHCAPRCKAIARAKR